VRLVTRPAIAALATVLVTLLALPGTVAADAPAQAPADPRAQGVGAALAVGQHAWQSEASVTMTLAAPIALVPSDGKIHRVNIGGRRLAIWCTGTGSPTVILEHGLGYGVDADSWTAVQAGVAKETRVCRYNRAFVDESDRAASGRSMPELTADLVALLKASVIPGPYILVGHSFGGLSVRNFALLYPESVAGMVLVDGSPPSAITNLDLTSERLNRPRVLKQLTQLKSLGPISLIVITRGIGLSASWRAAQVAMVDLSTRGRQVIASGSNHWIQLRQPDLVVRQILIVLHTVRRYR